MIVEKLKEWNAKFDIWSLFSDFFFLFGVFFLGWNPVLLIVWFMIDTSSMLFFAIILFHKERKSWIDTIGFLIISPMFVFFQGALYNSVIKFIKDVGLEDQINADPTQLINPILFPLIISFSILNHYASYSLELRRFENGTYNGAFIKHFFLRYILTFAIVLFMIAFLVYFELGLIVALIGVKAILRVFNKKSRAYI